eukprot:scaffold308063_cov18-Tisochrysis_lutea.AAC.1
MKGSCALVCNQLIHAGRQSRRATTKWGRCPVCLQSCITCEACIAGNMTAMQGHARTQLAQGHLASRLLGTGKNVTVIAGYMTAMEEHASAQLAKGRLASQLPDTDQKSRLAPASLSSMHAARAAPAGGSWGGLNRSKEVSSSAPGAA